MSDGAFGPGIQMEMFALGVLPDPSEVVRLADVARQMFGGE